MDTWIETANKLWSAILDRVKTLNAEGETLQAIANRVGAGSRQNVCAWLSGQRKGVGLAFPDLMSYAERLGLDYRNYFPGGEPPVQASAPSCATCKKLLAKEKEIQKLQQQIEKLKLELAKRDGMVEALERQLDRRDAGQAGRQEPPEERRAAG